MTDVFVTGPYLEAALICERILIEADTKSIIRIVDRLARVGTSMEMEPFDHDLSMFIRFKSGTARGSMPLEISMVKPSGESPAPMRNMIIFEGEEDRGLDIVMQLKIKFDQVGMYWFLVKLQDTVVTKIPLRILYLPQLMQISPQTPNL
jgi:hypothetical protein